MATWVDVECLMAYWYREGDHNAWAEWAELGQELEALAVHPLDTFGPEDRAILADVREDLIDQMVCVAEELRPQLRLATADRWSHKSLR